MAKGDKGFSVDPAEVLRVGEAFRLADVDPGSTPGLTSDKAAEKFVKAQAKELAELQERLYADSKVGGVRRVLVIVQAMDTGGKSGILRHVGGAIDPQGLRIHAFKKPTPEEREHHFLWRVRKQLPLPGIIGFFDRSHYEDVLIARVRGLAPPEEIEQRYAVINEFERELVADGTSLIKVMLHISAEEQKTRLAERLKRSDKHWKYNPGDLDERAFWNDYMAAYELVLQRCSTAEAPWYAVPANSKPYARAVVMRLLLDELRRMDLQWPKADFDPEVEQKRLAELVID